MKDGALSFEITAAPPKKPKKKAAAKIDKDTTTAK
jgi:ATP-dependent Clp protease ATP-binding subunit ClpA